MAAVYLKQWRQNSNNIVHRIFFLKKQVLEEKRMKMVPLQVRIGDFLEKNN